MPGSPVGSMRGEQGLGLVPPAELVAVPGCHAVEDARQDRHRARPRSSAPDLRPLDQLARTTGRHELAPQVAVHADGVGDIATRLGEIERRPSCSRPASRSLPAEQAGAERVPGVALVGRRAGGDRSGDRPAGGRSGRAVARPVEGVGVGRQHPRPGHGRRAVRHQLDGVLVGRQRLADPAGLEQAPAAALVEQRGAGPLGARVDGCEGDLDQLGGALDVAGAAGVVGGPVQQLVVGDRQLVSVELGDRRRPTRRGRPPRTAVPPVGRTPPRRGRPPRQRRAAPGPGAWRPTSGARAPAMALTVDEVGTVPRSPRRRRRGGAPARRGGRRRRWRCAAGRGGTGSGRRRRRARGSRRPRAAPRSAPAPAPRRRRRAGGARRAGHRPRRPAARPASAATTDRTATAAARAGRSTAGHR